MTINELFLANSKNFDLLSSLLINFEIVTSNRKCMLLLKWFYVHSALLYLIRHFKSHEKKEILTFYLLDPSFLNIRDGVGGHVKLHASYMCVMVSELDYFGKNGAYIHPPSP